jgi:4a-hydroxytetrahydrobiopterin dehydratase
MPAERLSESARRDLLEALPGWSAVEGRDAIRKTFEFSNFVEAFGWMTRVALVAEKLDHHPEWFNVYDRVEVTLTTHEAKGLTARDLEMANAMNRMATR